MKRTTFLVLSCGLAAAAVFLVQNALSQPRTITTRQLQVIGAAATNQTHGAWFVDLQASNVIFCERAAAGIHCQSAPIP
jgi:hypothetical protein